MDSEPTKTHEELEDEEDGETSDDDVTHMFSSPWHFSDVVLVVEDTKFYVHKCILSMWSPVFEAMFTGQFMESNAEEILLPGKRAEEVEQLLEMIYSSDAKQEVTETNYEFLLELAREYQMDRVQQYCTQYMKQDIDKNNCLHRYKVADHFGIEDVKEKCNEEARFKSSAVLKESEDFLNLGFESKFELCMARIKELENALTQYAGICSPLVTGYYEDLSSRIPSDIGKCDNKISHKPYYADFDSSCWHCRHSIGWYKGKQSMGIGLNAVALFNDLFVQLYELEDSYNVAKIIRNLNGSEPWVTDEDE